MLRRFSKLRHPLTEAASTICKQYGVLTRFAVTIIFIINLFIIIYYISVVVRYNIEKYA